MGDLTTLIGALVGILLPAAEHALGIDAPVTAKQQWVVDGVKDVMHNLVFARIKMPSFAVAMEAQIEELVGKELAKLLAQAETHTTA